MEELLHNHGYRSWLSSVKEQFCQSQLKASLAVNSELLRFYWYLGAEIARLKKSSSWGSGFLKQLSKDLTEEFKGFEGCSERNLLYIRQFYERYAPSFGQQAVAQLETAPNQTGTIPPQAGAESLTLLLTQLHPYVS